MGENFKGYPRSLVAQIPRHHIILQCRHIFPQCPHICHLKNSELDDQIHDK